MIVKTLDPQTIRDLELFQGSAGGSSVFGLLDRTRTQDGRRRLQHRFKTPLTAVAEIGEVQNVLRFLIGAGAGPDRVFPFAQRDLDWMQGYLDSNFVTLRPEKGPFGWLACRVKWARNREFRHFVEQGVKGALAFLNTAAGFFGWLGQGSPPATIREDLRLFQAILAHGALTDLLRDPLATQLGPRDFLEVDFRLRYELQDSLRRLLERLADLDSLLSMARVTKERGFAFPEFVGGDAPLVQIRGAFHPFVTDPVLNDLVLDGACRLLFLTGPNMAGKTTFMKGATIAVLLAHLGMGVPAREMRLTGFSRIFCSLTAMDDIQGGVSSFCSEIRRVKEVLEAVQQGGRVFAVFDELFKGTNVKDALDCSSAVINGFAGLPGNLFVVSSHLLELRDLIADRSVVGFRCFDARSVEGRTEFDYCLREGVNDKRFGYRLLVEEGVLELLSGPGV